MSDMRLAYQDRVIDEMKLSAALNKRKIYFNEDVNRDSVFKAVYLLDRIVELDRKENKVGKEDIEIVLNCEGGIIYFGNSLISKIFQLRNMGYNVITTVDSIAMSMGAMFLICGSERRAVKYSTIMFHSPSSVTWGRLQDMEEDMEETKRLWDVMKRIIIENTDITDDKLEEIKLRKYDWYLDAETALSLNVIDKII